MQEGHGGGTADGVVAVSKGVIQRDHQHAATITGENLFQPPNPFNRMSEDDVDSYKADIEKQSQTDSGRWHVVVVVVMTNPSGAAYVGGQMSRRDEEFHQTLIVWDTSVMSTHL